MPFNLFTKLSVNDRSFFGALIGGFVGGVVVFMSFQASFKKDGWDIATALGTIAAAVAAVGIAVWQDVVRRRDAVLRARLTATLLVKPLALRIDGYRRSSAKLAEALARVDADTVGIFTWPQVKNYVFASVIPDVLAILKESDDIPFEQLVIVSAISREHAETVAKVNTNVRYIVSALSAKDAHQSITADGVKSYARQLQEAAAQLIGPWKAYQDVTFGRQG